MLRDRPRPHSQEVAKLGFKTTYHLHNLCLNHSTLLTSNLNIFILKGTVYHNRNGTPVYLANITIKNRKEKATCIGCNQMLALFRRGAWQV